MKINRRSFLTHASMALMLTLAGTFGRHISTKASTQTNMKTKKTFRDYSTKTFSC
ncbi:MAG: hypothetical protein OXT03_01735 [Alphaproteobacteria bacterium]|nr:hypothetical protein [Alphaproteobacteria bacterium]